MACAQSADHARPQREGPTCQSTKGSHQKPACHHLDLGHPDFTTEGSKCLLFKLPICGTRLERPDLTQAGAISPRQKLLLVRVGGSPAPWTKGCSAGIANSDQQASLRCLFFLILYLRRCPFQPRRSKASVAPNSSCLVSSPEELLTERVVSLHRCLVGVPKSSRVGVLGASVVTHLNVCTLLLSPPASGPVSSPELAFASFPTCQSLGLDQTHCRGLQVSACLSSPHMSKLSSRGSSTPTRVSPSSLPSPTFAGSPLS